MKKRHNFHILVNSPWPLVSALSAFITVIGLTLYMHFYTFGLFVFFFGLVFILLSMFVWWRDVLRESVFEGKHTLVVKKGLSFGVLLFIVSEVMFFFSFFWAFFHGSLAPGVELGCVWPPVGIQSFDPWGTPLLNSFFLLLSGASVTLAHYALVANKLNDVHEALVFTLVFAMKFTSFQVAEYCEAPFSISDGLYGSTFYLATGFHGFHVIVGTVFLSVCFFRNIEGSFFSNRHLGFLFAAWYWHFVDVVWLFLFLTIYWWGGF